MARLKIAVYSIALNEIKHVDRYAQATKDADYVIVADTGSTDGTQEALKKHGITVHNISVKPWRFDDARNAALALVPEDADVCLILDLDEVPEPEFFSKIRDGWVEGSDAAWITMHTDDNKWDRDRIHSRYNWRWKYPCHEVNIWYGEGNPKHCEIRNAVIAHKPDNTKSRGQYLGLLELAVKEFPEDARMWTYMCREYFFYKVWEEVIKAAEKQNQLNGWFVESAAVCRWAAEAAHQLGREEEATAWYNKGVQYCPTDGEPWFGVCMDAYRKQDWQRCLDAALTIIDLPRSSHYCYESAVWDWRAFDLASIACWNLNHFEQAVTFATEAANANGPEQERIERNLNLFKETLSATRAHK